MFADALVAGILTDGPVLLVPACGGIPAVVTAEIARLGPGTVVALGGTGAVCEATLNQAAAGRAKDRLSGADRYATAVAISQYQFPDPSVVDEVYLANGQESADAVVGGILTRGPILPVRPTGALPAVVAAEIARLDPVSVVALGGPVAVSQAVLDQAAQGRSQFRLSGADRYATAVAIARHRFASRSQVVYLAHGSVFADAVASGSLTDGPVLLVRPGCAALPPVVRDYLVAAGPAQVIALGGEQAVCQQVVDQAVELAASSTQLRVTTISLPPAKVGVPYTAVLTGAGGTPPYRWDDSNGIASVEVAPGLRLDGDGVVFGIPHQAGTFPVYASLRDSRQPVPGWSFAYVPLTVEEGFLPTEPATQLSTGTDHNCVVTPSGRVKCWGYGQSGALGDGTFMDANVPVEVIGLEDVEVVQVSAGGGHTCAVTATGGVKCWGFNSSGQLGDGTTTDSPVPVDVVGLGSGVVQVDAASSSTCAVLATGAVKCWGEGSRGQLGNGSQGSSSVPVDVLGLPEGVVQVSGGNMTTCVVTTLGAAKCWGGNTTGQVGDGTNVDVLTPTQVVGLEEGVVQVSTGWYTTCAVTTGGAVKCWGRNLFGEMGNGSLDGSLVPVDVVGLDSGAASVQVKAFISCAVMQTGAAKCWGHRAAAGPPLGDKPGDGEKPPYTPVDVTFLGDVKLQSVALGLDHNCYLLEAGTVKCAGMNTYSQLGYGSTEPDVHGPVDVLGIG